MQTTIPACEGCLACSCTKCLRLRVKMARPSAEAISSTILSGVDCWAFPASWRVSTLCPSLRNASTAGNGKFSSANSRAIDPRQTHSLVSVAQSLLCAHERTPMRWQDPRPALWGNFSRYPLRSCPFVGLVLIPRQGFLSSQDTDPLRIRLRDCLCLGSLLQFHAPPIEAIEPSPHGSSC